MRILILLTSILLVACQSAQGHAHSESKADEDAVVSPGKPQHPLQVQLLRPARMQPGVESKAELVVKSSQQLENITVQLRPESGMMLSQERFERRGSDIAASPLKLPFRVTPSAENQQVTVLMQATLPDGRLISREVVLPLAGDVRTSKGDLSRKVPDRPDTAVQTRDEDVVMPAEQEVIREDDGGNTH